MGTNEMGTDLITRRAAIKLAGLVALTVGHERRLFSGTTNLAARGYGSDTDLLKRDVSWPKTLSSSHLAMLAILCDIVLPAEPPHPSATDIRVHEFLDEWVSAPYPQMRLDRQMILKGLTALNDAARAEVGIPFANARLSWQTAVWDRLCETDKTMDFCRRVIELICDGYYTTRQGHAAIGYIGNVPLSSFPAPPPEILRRLDNALSELRRPERAT